MTQVWRLNIKPDSENGVNSRDFCIDKKILGIGWRVETNKDTLDWDEYYSLASQKFGDNSWTSAINVLKNRMVINDLCWTRDLNGIYYLGRITSEWRYQGNQEYAEADIINVRDCDWVKIGTVDAVPGKVVNSFIPARTVQVVNGKTVIAISKYLYNTMSSNYKYEILTDEISDVFSLMSSWDCEDVVGIYIQKKFGYIMIPTTCKKGTMDYEFVLKHSLTGEKAVAQVKNGAVDLDISHYAQVPAKIFLFTSRGRYIGDNNLDIICIKPEELLDFVKANMHLMPESVQMWFELTKQGGSTGQDE